MPSINRKQRATLAVGAVALMVAVFSTPRVQYYQGGAVLKASSRTALANVMHLREAIVRGLTVIAGTALLVLATQDR